MRDLAVKHTRRRISRWWAAFLASAFIPGIRWIGRDGTATELREAFAAQCPVDAVCQLITAGEIDQCIYDAFQYMAIKPVNKDALNDCLNAAGRTHADELKESSVAFARRIEVLRVGLESTPSPSAKELTGLEQQLEAARAADDERAFLAVRDKLVLLGRGDNENKRELWVKLLGRVVWIGLLKTWGYDKDLPQAPTP